MTGPKEIQRLEKFLESSGIKLSGTVANLMGASSRAMLEALIDGERDPEWLAALARGSLRSKIPELVEALTGRFSEHHAFLARMHLERIDALTGSMGKLTGRIEDAMAPFRTAREFLTTIPGVSTLVADTIIAETGADMTPPAAGTGDPRRGSYRLGHSGRGPVLPKRDLPL